MKTPDIFAQIQQWLRNDGELYQDVTTEEMNKVDRNRLAIFIALHLACFGVLFVSFSWYAVLFAVALYFARMFAITAFYHRYFSHRTFKASRSVQFLMAFIGCTAGQRGPIWWAGHHRQHHITSDTEKDPHSPKQGFLNSHTLWFLRKVNFATPKKHVNDLMRYPEIVWLDRFDWVPFIALAAMCYITGWLLSIYVPEANISGAQFLFWGFFVSTIILYHGTYTINSLAHRFGSRRYEIADDSRNNFLLALITLGEGWHNNHHRYPGSTKQGFFWWEIDISYLLIRAMAAIGLVSELRPVPNAVLAEARRR